MFETNFDLRLIPHTLEYVWILPSLQKTVKESLREKIEQSRKSEKPGFQLRSAWLEPLSQ